MLCYRCGSHVQDATDTCPTCGQKLSATGMRQATGTFSRRRQAGQQLEGAPYKPQDLVANRYLVKDTVGAGPLGFVFRAHDKEIDVEVALKVINPRLVQSADERKQFAKVLRGARKLSHPNLVRVYEEGEEAERPFFTSQFLDGLTLRKIIDLRLQKGQFFALHEIEPILAQVCAALEGAHKVGPHTNIKPDNVLVLPDLLKVTDYGLGLALPRLPFVQAMKARKADRYFAPEFAEGGEIDGRADVYSVGVILGEMLSGLTPDGAVPELQRRNPDVPQAIEGLYRKALNSNPNARFRTAAEFIQDYSELVKKHAPAPASSQPRTEPATGSQSPSRPRTNTGMLQLQPRREQPRPPPPMPGIPPPPPPPSGEMPIPDATQPVDPARLQALISPAADAPENRQETDVIDSGQFIASLEDDVDTRAMVETVPQPGTAARRTSSGMWMVVAALVVLGVLLGAGGGYYLIQKQRAAVEAQKQKAEADRRAAEEQARLEAERLAQLNTPEAQAAAKVRAEADRIAAEKALAERALLERALADQAAEKALAEKAAADKLAAERAAADRAGADRVAAEKLAAERAAAEKAAAEKLAADKAAADKAAADKAAAEKLAADKAAADKAAADKAAAEKAAKDKALAAATPAAASGGCPEGMRPVAAGAFKMGTSRDDPMMGFDEKPLAAVIVPGFCIDAFEYPNKKGAAPMASVTFQDAQRLCEAQGKRLCSEAEWEKSCKGTGPAKWPYGTTFDPAACNTEDDAGDARSLSTAGRFAKCRSVYGVSDLSGNVAEWTAEKTIKGGSFASGDFAVRCAARKNGSGFNRSTEVGFRCCADLH